MSIEGSTTLLRWIILAPLAGAALNGLIFRNKSALLSGLVGTTAALAAFLVSVYAAVSLGTLDSAHFAVDAWFTWFDVGRIHVPFYLELTPITTVMLMVVTGVGSLIHIYSIGYMAHDQSPWRFFSYLNLFLAAMLVLVLSSSLVGVFMGWEGVGLCSYLLIGYWYGTDANTRAGTKAFITNRIGDLGFLFALFAVFSLAGTGQIRELVQMVGSGHSLVPPVLWLMLAGGIFWASTGKSAQIPLYVWLPDAMAGPTPVSALIHAATMVTSGIFVTARLWPIFSIEPEVLHVMLAVGIATAWLAALIALTQRDIKRVLAYSTVSQLGFMFAALGAGAPTAALFHVVTHACFKALLFLGAGSVIHGMHEKQDLFEMGKLRLKMTVTHATFLIGTLAIIGFPLSSGFFSKDAILAEAFRASPVAYFLLLGAALLTAIYMLRAYSLAFWGEARSEEARHAHESPKVILVPLAVLAFLSIFVGWFETPRALGGINAFGNWVSASWYGVVPHVEAESAMGLGLEWILLLFTSVTSLTVAWFSYRRFRGMDAKAVLAGPRVSSPVAAFLRLSQNKFYVDEIYEYLLLRPLSFVAEFSTRLLDTRVINGTLNGVRDGLKFSGRALALFHTGNVQTYAWYLAFGSAAAVVISWMVLR